MNVSAISSAFYPPFSKVLSLFNYLKYTWLVRRHFLFYFWLISRQFWKKRQFKKTHNWFLGIFGFSFDWFHGLAFLVYLSIDFTAFWKHQQFWSNIDWFVDIDLTVFWKICNFEAHLLGLSADESNAHYTFSFAYAVKGFLIGYNIS